MTLSFQSSLFTNRDQRRDTNAIMSSDETIISLILRDNESQAIESDFLAQYVSQLSSLGVNNLNTETQRLSDLRSNVIEKTQHLAFNNYKTFISNGECAQRVTNDLVGVEDTVHHIIDSLPQLVDNCRQFEGQAKQICVRWREVSLMLSKHPQLLEVLEIPQLMDTCVRNGFYEESLQLYSYVDKLKKRFADSLPIISSIAEEVTALRETMISQLMKDMSSNIQLQNCLKIVGYLRQTEKFSESELRIRFLSARDQWLNSVVNDIPATNPLIHITKVIEANRVNLFDIVTQYRAIFADSEPILSQKHMYYGITNMSSDRDFNDSAIIQSWLLYKVDQFVEVLTTDLNQCVDNEFGHYYPIESVVEPAFYFGLSLSRIGADIRPKIIPIINNAISKRFSLVVNEATNKFENQIQSFTLASHPINTSTANLVSSDDQESIAPVSLLEFPVLAQYCNDMLTALNEIRRTTPLMAISSLTNTMNESLQRVSNAISKYFRSEESGLTSDEKQILLRFCSQYVNELLPHLIKCFDRIVCIKSVADKLGVSLIEFNKVRQELATIDGQSTADSVTRLLASTHITSDAIPQTNMDQTSDETSKENNICLETETKR